MNNRSLLMNGAMWMALAKIASMVISLASTALLARFLSPADFGLVAIASTAAIIIAAMTELSLTQALVHHEEPTQDHFDTAFTLNLLRASLLAAIIVGLGWPVGWAYGDERLIGIMAVLGLATFISGLASPKMVIFQRKLDFTKDVAVNMADKIAGFVVGVFVAYVYQSYWALVLGVLASQTARTLLSIYFVPYRPRLTLAQTDKLLGFSIWLTLANWIQALNWRSDPIVLGYFLPNTQLGYYTLSNRISVMAVNELLSPLGQVLFPAYSRIRGDAQRLRSAYMRAQGLLCMIALPLGAGITVLADPLVRVALGDQWLPAVPIIQYLCAVAALENLHGVLPLALATGNTKALFQRDARAILIRVPLFFGGLYVGYSTGMGMLLGAVIGRTIAGVINILWNMRLISQFSSVRVVDHFAVAWRPGVAALAMFALVEVLRENFQITGPDFASVLAIGELVAAGVLSYLFALAALWLLFGRRAGAEAEIMQLVKDAWVKGRMRFAGRSPTGGSC